jgi:hypothetical protein
MERSGSASNLKGKFEDLAKPAPEPEKKTTKGRVGWNDDHDQGAKKIHKGGMTVFGDLPAKKSLSDLP